MIERAIEPVGTEFGRLTIAGEPRGGRNRKYPCTCSCGNPEVKWVQIGNLRSGHTQSCGCYRRERSEATCKLGLSRTHGMSQSHPLYVTWLSMRNRCNNPRCHEYHSYGGRGIYVDSRWDDFVVWLADMGDKPSPEYSIDRRDNDGPYSPENCRWATPAEQAINKRPRGFSSLKGKPWSQARRAAQTKKGPSSRA